MTILVLVGGVVLLTVAVAALAWPLLRQREEPAVAEATAAQIAVADPLAELSERRDAIYRAIKELEFDYQVGKVSEADYQAFSAQLKAEAAAVLREMDALEAAAADPALDAAIEAQVAALRRQPQTASSPASPQAAPLPSSAQARFCTRCGHQAQPGDRFCGRCGAPLRFP